MQISPAIECFQSKTPDYVIAFLKIILLKKFLFLKSLWLKIKTNYPLMPFFLAISCFISAEIIFSTDYSLISIVNGLMWLCFALYIFSIKQVFTLEVHKRPLIAEVFIIESKKEAQYIKTQIK